jgi:hypothetical protein
MKKLNKTEREAYAEIVMQKEKQSLISKSDNNGRIKKILLEAKRLEKLSDKAEFKAEMAKSKLTNFINVNRVLIEGSYGSIILKRDHDWNRHEGKYMYNTRVEFDQSAEIQQKLEKAIILAGIDAETKEQLDEKVFELMTKEDSLKLLT